MRVKTADEIVNENNALAKEMREFFQMYESLRAKWGFRKLTIRDLKGVKS